VRKENKEAPLPRRAQCVRRAYVGVGYRLLYDISRGKFCWWLINHFYSYHWPRKLP